MWCRDAAAGSLTVRRSTALSPVDGPHVPGNRWVPQNSCWTSTASSERGGNPTAPRVHRQPIQDHRHHEGAPVSERGKPGYPTPPPAAEPGMLHGAYARKYQAATDPIRADQARRSITTPGCCPGCSHRDPAVWKGLGGRARRRWGSGGAAQLLLAEFGWVVERVPVLKGPAAGCPCHSLPILPPRSAPTCSWQVIQDRSRPMSCAASRTVIIGCPASSIGFGQPH